MKFITTVRVQLLIMGLSFVTGFFTAIAIIGLH